MSQKSLNESSSLLLREDRPTDTKYDQRMITLGACWTALILNLFTLVLGIRTFLGKTHPLCMIVAFFLLTSAMLLFRIVRSIVVLSWRHSFNTTHLEERVWHRLHYVMIVVVLILVCMGIFDATHKHPTDTTATTTTTTTTTKKDSTHHNDAVNNIHVVLGWTALACLLLQILIGGGAMSVVRINPHHNLIHVHRILGPCLVQVVFAAAMINGILHHDNKTCNVNDAANKNDMVSCGHLLAILIGLTSLCTILGIVPMPRDHPEEQVTRTQLIV